MRRFFLPLAPLVLLPLACPSPSAGEGEGDAGEGEGGEGEGEGEEGEGEGEGEEGEGDGPLIDNDFGFTLRTPQTRTLPCDNDSQCPGGTFTARDVDYVCSFVHDDVDDVVYLRATPTRVEAVFFPLPVYDDVSAFVAGDDGVVAVDAGYDFGGNHHNDVFFIVVDGVRYNFSHSSFGFGFRACQPPDCLQIETDGVLVDGCGAERALPIACVEVADPLPPLPTSFEKCLGDPNRDEAAFVEVLDDVSDLDDLENADGAVKFVGPREFAAVTPPVGERCLFQDTAAQPAHLDFLQSLEGGEGLSDQDYIANVIRRATRVWWGGEVHFAAGVPHPITGQPGFLQWSIYTDDTAGNRLVADDIRETFALMTRCAPAFAGRLAFVPGTPEQRATASVARDALEAEGIAVFIP